MKFIEGKLRKPYAAEQIAQGVWHRKSTKSMMYLTKGGHGALVSFWSYWPLQNKNVLRILIELQF